MAEHQYRALRELPFSVLAEVLGVDISKYRRRKGGTEYSGPCIFHNPKRSSTSFSYASNGAFQCFSCNEKGRGAIDAVMKARRVGFQQAVDVLQPYAGSAILHRPISKPEIKQVQELPVENPPFDGGKYRKYAVRSEWLLKRNLEPRTLERFGLFQYSNPAGKGVCTGKILIPVRRYRDGALVAYLARTPTPAEGESTDDWPNGFHKSLEVYGAAELREEHALPLRIIYWAESPFTVLRFWQMGLPCVSTFGWSISRQQADIIGELANGVVALPDADKAEAFSTYAHALARRVWVRCPPLTDGMTDPEQLSLEQIKALT